MEIFGYLIYVLVALFAAFFSIAATFLGGAGIHRLGDTRFLQIVTVLVSIGATILPAAIRISSGLDVDDPRGAGEIESGVFALVWAKRVVTVLTLFVCTAGLVKNSRRLFGLPTDWSRILYGYVLFVALSFGLGAAFSTVPALVLPLYYPVVVVVAILLAKEADFLEVLKVARACLAIVLVGSIVLGAVHPAWGFGRVVNNYLPFLPGRLVGLTSHPNVLGALALLYLLITFKIPSDSKFRRSAMVTISLAVLVLAQSKTVLGAAAIIGLGTATYSLVSKGNFYRSKFAPWFVFGGIALISLLFIGALAYFLSYGSRVPALLSNSKLFSSLTSFVGRSEIWDITLGLWERSPIFGYGQTLWSTEFSAKYLMLYVGQAHNQFVQTLGDSGLVGLLGLLIYLGVLIRTGVKHARISQGASLAILIFVLMRCATETPIRSMGVSDPTFLMHALALLSLLYWSSRTQVPDLPSRGAS